MYSEVLSWTDGIGAWLLEFVSAF
ncbi:unnamed protein product, partial [Vitis vinifera]